MAIERETRISAALVLAAGLALGALALVSCKNNDQANAPLGPSVPMPTPGPTPVPVVASGLTFFPNSLTLTSGAPVSFNLPGHTVHIDDGTASGTCSSTDITTGWPVNHSFVGPSGTTFYIHCDYHSCGTACLVTCTGMVMTVHIQ